MANVAFKKGLLENLPNTYAEGTFYVTTDERAIYLDVSDSARVRLGDFQEFATVAALEANTNPSTTALYYVTEINCLAKWDGTKYVQINLDTGATSVEVTGSGNAITNATYDASARKITFTKGATYMTSSDVDGKITALDLANTYYSKSLGEANATAISNIKDGTSIDSFGDVETALEGKETAGAAAAVLGASNDAATANTVYGAKAAAAAAKSAADAAQGDADALETLVGTIPSGASATTVTGYAAEVAGAAETAAKAVANAKVASVTAGNNGVVVGGTATAPTVGVKLSPKAGNGLSIETGSGEEGLYFSQAAAPEYTIAQQASAESGYAATYYLTKDGTQVGSKINIPKDFLVKSASVETVTTADTPYTGAQVGDKYIDFVINAKDASATAEHLYLPVNDLVDVYTSGSSAGDMVVIAIDSNNQITATIADGTVTLAKLASAVQTEINKAHTHSNKALLDTYTQTEADLADAVSKKHSHANSAVLDGITAEKVTAWDSAGHVYASATQPANLQNGDLWLQTFEE